MFATPISEPMPIRADEHGRLRVGDTRVLLDLVIYAYWRGATPETITQSYPSLSLEEVYLALGYYLRHRAELDAYLREQEAEAVQAEATHERSITREMLLARLQAKQSVSDA
jgi:uncharacterized protein (DUF433 family)